MDTFTIQQDIFIDYHPAISVTSCREDVLTLQQLGTFLKTANGHIGVAPVYDEKCCLSKLAMATACHVLLITFSPNTATTLKKSKKTVVRLALESLFSHPDVTVYAFKMNYVAVALFLNHGIRLAAGKHLLSVSTRRQLDGLLETLGERRVALDKTNIINLFRNEESSANLPKTTALQAWAAYQAATMPETCGPVLEIPVINTLAIDPTVCIYFYLPHERPFPIFIQIL